LWVFIKESLFWDTVDIFRETKFKNIEVLSVSKIYATEASDTMKPKGKACGIIQMSVQWPTIKTWQSHCTSM